MMLYDPEMFEYLARSTLLNIYDALIPRYISMERQDPFAGPCRIVWSGQWADVPHAEYSGGTLSLDAVDALFAFYRVHKLMGAWVCAPWRHRDLIFSGAAKSLIRDISETFSQALGLSHTGSPRGSILLDSNARLYLPLSSDAPIPEVSEELRKVSSALFLFFKKKRLASWTPAQWEVSTVSVKDVPYVTLTRGFVDYHRGCANKAGQELASRDPTVEKGETVLPGPDRNPLIQEYKVRLWIPAGAVVASSVLQEVTADFTDTRARLIQEAKAYKAENLLCRVALRFKGVRSPEYLSMHKSFAPFVDRQDILWYKDLFDYERPLGISLNGIESVKVLEDLRQPCSGTPWEYRDA